MLIKIGGKCVFSGEYALLYGFGGVCCLFDECLTFEILDNLNPNFDVVIHSDKYGDYFFNLNGVEKVDDDFAFFWRVCSILNLKNIAINIKTESAFDGGFGFSGAVIIALVLYYFKKFENESMCNVDFKRELFLKCLGVLKEISPKSSGVDIATQIYGGVVYYDVGSSVVQSLDSGFLDMYKIIAVSCGYKKSTSECLDVIYKSKTIDEVDALIGNILSCALEVKHAIENKEYILFEEKMNYNNQLLIQLGVYDAVMMGIVKSLEYYNPNIVKISGSGLGDCILAFFDKSFDEGVLQKDVVLSKYKFNVLNVLKDGVFYE
jgi:mevalonate kinase